MAAILQGVTGMASGAADLEARQLRAVLDSVSDLVVTALGDGTITYASPSAHEWLGLPPDELVGHSVAEFIDVVRHAGWKQALDEMAATGGRFGPYETDLSRVDGTTRRVQVLVGTYPRAPHSRPGATGRSEGADTPYGLVLTVRELSGERAVTEAVNRSEARYQALLDGVSDIILLLGYDGDLRYASPAAERILGLHLDSPGTDLLELLHPDDRAEAIEGLAWLRDNPEVPDDPGVTPWRPPSLVRVCSSDGSWHVLEILGRNLVDDPEVNGLLITARDITEVRQRDEQAVDGAALLERLARGAPMTQTLAQLLDNQRKWLPGGVPVVALPDTDGVLRLMPGHDLPSDLAAVLDDVGPHSAIGRTSRAEHQPVVITDIGDDPEWGEVGRLFVEHDLHALWQWLLRADDGRELGLIAVFLPTARAPSEHEALLFSQAAHLASIVIQRHLAEEALAHQALHDALTGLPNRTLLVDRIDQALALSSRSGDAAAVLFCDLDRFKFVNDSLGHAAGDRLLCMVADRWETLLRQGDTVGRFGGDEFVVVANAVEGAKGADALAGRLIDALRQPFLVDGVEVVVGVSVGVAVAFAGRGEADQLIRDADSAMYAAKAKGRGGFVLFERPMHDEAVERFQLEADLRRAVPGDELVVHYQPMLRVEDRAVVGVEALVRWERPGHGLVLPSEFVDVAEETGIIVPMGSWVLREVFRQAASWSHDPVLADLRISANLSARQLVEPGLVEEVQALTAEFGVDPTRVWLEVTESVLADDPDAVATAIERLFDLQVRVAIDDFGAGYTSLEYARRFAMVSALKIDRNFVVDLEKPGSHAEAIVGALVVLGRGLDALVIAEGVETASQFEALRRLGCEYVQGFLFGRPVAADDLRRRILVLQAAGSPAFSPDRAAIEARFRRSG